MAKRLGATHGIDTSSVANLGDEVRRITDGSGSTITVDATGVMPLIQQGLDFTANQGKMVLLGVAPMTAGLEISVVPFMVVSFLAPATEIHGLRSSRQASSLLAVWKAVCFLRM
jgi:Zn-dependent alcohol dehydrogenase